MKRFWDKVDVSGSCWEWQGCKVRGGYGAFKVNGKGIRAHRFSYKLAFGPIPDGIYVCHHCDNAKCVKPSHLFLGTQTDNMQDCISKGRFGEQGGEANGNSKICEDDVREIRRLYSLGITQVWLSKMWGIGRSQTNRIVNREQWKHI